MQGIAEAQYERKGTLVVFELPAAEVRPRTPASAWASTGCLLKRQALINIRDVQPFRTPKNAEFKPPGKRLFRTGCITRTQAFSVRAVRRKSKSAFPYDFPAAAVCVVLTPKARNQIRNL